MNDAKLPSGAPSDINCKQYQDLVNSMIEKQYIIGKFFDLLQNEMKTNEKLFNEMQTTNLFLGKIPIQYIMNN